MKPIAYFFAGLACCVPLAAQASSTIYRCGNEYTNHPARIARGGCVPVQGGAVTVMRHAARGVAPAPGRPVVMQPARAVLPRAQVAAPAQRVRDAQARTILQAELNKASQRLGELRREYNNGEPERLGSEAHNYQKYLNRVAGLRADIQRTESDIAGIQRELQRAGS